MIDELLLQMQQKVVDAGEGGFAGSGTVGGYGFRKDSRTPNREP